MEIAVEYKINEMGKIPKEWVISNLIEKSTLKARIGWQGLTTKEYLDTGDFYLITGTDFQNGRINFDNCYFVEEERYSQDKNIQIKLDDILVTKEGTIGKVAYIDKITKPATLNSGVFVIRPINNAYYSKYMYYVFNSIYFNDFLRKLVAGSTINHLYQKDFVSFSFPLPPLPEQKAIAEVLSDTDNLIQALERQIAKKSEIKQGVMQMLLSPQDGWEEKKIGEIGNCFAGGTPSTFIDDYWNGSIFWLPSGRVQNNILKVSDKEITITQKGLENSAAKIIRSNSVLVAITGATCGNIAFLSFEAAANQSVVAIETYNKYNSKFIFYLLLLNRKKILALQTGSAQGGTNLKSIKSILLFIPNIEEQNRIAGLLCDMEDEILLLENKLKKCISIKKGLMQNLLSGKIRLNIS